MIAWIIGVALAQPLRGSLEAEPQLLPHAWGASVHAAGPLDDGGAWMTTSSTTLGFRAGRVVAPNQAPPVPDAALAVVRSGDGWRLTWEDAGVDVAPFTGCADEPPVVAPVGSGVVVAAPCDDPTPVRWVSGSGEVREGPEVPGVTGAPKVVFAEDPSHAVLVWSSPSGATLVIWDVDGPDFRLEPVAMPVGAPLRFATPQTNASPMAVFRVPGVDGVTAGARAGSDWVLAGSGASPEGEVAVLYRIARPWRSVSDVIR